MQFKPSSGVGKPDTASTVAPTVELSQLVISSHELICLNRLSFNDKLYLRMFTSILVSLTSLMKTTVLAASASNFKLFPRRLYRWSCLKSSKRLAPTRAPDNSKLEAS